MKEFKNTYFISRYIYLRLFGLVFFFAFSSLFIQLDGLYGKSGILPVHEFMSRIRSNYDFNFLMSKMPSLLWFAGPSAGEIDNAMYYMCVAGMVLSFLCFLGLCHSLVFLSLYVLYLSFVHMGQSFLSFQWDILILEGSFIAVFVAPLFSLSTISRKEPAPWMALFMNKWLIFRLLTGSGLVKLNNTWTDLTAMNYHYETTCLPNPLSWYMHQLPESVHKTEVYLTLFVEIFVTAMVFAERIPRTVGTIAQIILQIAILSTGNYTFFNFLSITFLVLVLDDYFWLKYILPNKIGAYFVNRLGPKNKESSFSIWKIVMWLKSVFVTCALAYLFVSSIQPFFNRHIKHDSLPAVVNDVYATTQPFMLTNSYGLFAGMTKIRDEIIIQGSNNKSDWQTYEFKFKPGDLHRAPPIVAPHQPRLDWQMWFAALSEAKKQQWFLMFVKRLLEGSSPVLSLLEYNPFPQHPPKYIRALRYRYNYTNSTSNSAWWKRKKIGTYLEPIVLEQLRSQ